VNTTDGTSIPILYYDAQCILCKSFAQLLSRKISPEELVLSPMNAEERRHARDFRVSTPEGELQGKDAISWLAARLPAIRQFFWMLPDSYRTSALIRTYSFAKKIRRWFGRSCRCGED